MADRQHVFRSAVDPSSAPAQTGHHWVNESTGRIRLSTGTASAADWKLVPELENAITDGELTKSPTSNAVFDALALKEPVGAAAAAIVVHEAAVNPHPQYALDTDVSNAIAAHVADANPHPLYATDADLSAGLATKENTGVAAALFAARSILTAANSGLSGGGDLSADRSLSIDINNLAAQTTRPLLADQVAIYQTDTRKLSLREFLARRGRTQDQAFLWSTDFVISETNLLSGAGAGAGNSTQQGNYGMDNVERAVGISETDTGTTATGRRTVSSALNSLTTGLGRIRFGARYAINQLSNGTDTFTTYVGFLNISGAGDHTAGAYFRYTHGVNGGRWEAVTAGGGGSPTRTEVDTTVTADVLYSIFEVEIAEDASAARFYINDVLVATITTNIPPMSVAANFTFGYGWKIEKSVGTAVVAHSTDWAYFELERATAR